MHLPSTKKKPPLGSLKTNHPAAARPLQRLKARLLAKGFRARDLQQAFVFGMDRPLDVNVPNHHLRRVRLEHPGFPEVRIHNLRHTAASLWLAQSLDVSLAAEKLGHANPGVTSQAYWHLLHAERCPSRSF
ncbi:MAG: hypothetical protein KatS3mg071_1511 [Meiothermus sp.]|nr:MAG: hypothetical protein KatS3mg071_1511 [Meiothermus sp.]